MKRRYLVLVLLVLLIVPLGLQSSNQTTHIQGPTETFTVAGDGDESSESITSFSETLADDSGLDPDSDTNGDFSKAEWTSGESLTDDTLFYPDLLENTTIDTAEIGLFSGSGEVNDWTATEAQDATVWSGDAGCDLILNFTITSETRGFDYAIYAKYSGLVGNAEFQIYDFTAEGWIKLNDLTLSYAWYNGTSYDQDYMDTTDNVVMLRLETTGTKVPYWDYGELSYYIMTLADSDHYAESFVDVSEWIEGTWANSTPDGTFTTDEDVASMEEAYEGGAGNDNDGWYTNGPSLPSTNYYYEIRYRVNITGNSNPPRLYFFDEDGQGGNYPYIQLQKVTDWTTESGHFTWTCIGSGTGIESVLFILLMRSGDDPIKWDIDYFRISPDNERGWQHDGSTTDGNEDGVGFTGWSYDYSTDGDILNVTHSRSGGASGYGTSYINYDTTTTKADIETSYHSWLEMKWSLMLYGANPSASIMVYVDGKYSSETTERVGGEVFTSNRTSTIDRLNLVELTGASADIRIRILGAGDDGDSAQFLIDYVKFYGMINWTYDLSITNSLTSSVSYYDSAESAIVIEKAVDASNDVVQMETLNTSIGLGSTDMVMVVTAKAEANTTARLRLFAECGAYDTNMFYYLSEDYQQIAVPFKVNTHTLSWFRLDLWDWASNTPASGTIRIYVKDNITLRPSWYDASEESGTYADSFAVVTDWTEYGISAEDSVSTDGDTLIIEGYGNSDNEYDGVQYDFSSQMDCRGHYYEMRFRQNLTGAQYDLTYLSFYNLTGSTAESHVRLENLVLADIWYTVKGYYPLDYLDRIYIRPRLDAGQQLKFEVDYIRIAPADEMGVQIDGSMFDFSNPLQADSYDTDGDVLHFVGTDASYMEIHWDFIYSISDTHYQFMELRYKATATHSLRMYFEDEDGGGDTYPQITTSASGSWTTCRLNLASLADIDMIRHFAVRDDNDGAQELWIDYLKFYSIANYTVVVGASMLVTGVAYVEDAALTITTTGGPSMSFNFDPAISVASASYSVWNMTLTSAYTTYLLYLYHGDWHSWTGETRGATPSGTVTDVQFNLNTPVAISALKFIEDGTAPTISDFWTVPYTPTEEDDLTLAIYETDTVGTYTVTFNAVDYPAGFNDIDYEATESSTKSGLWSYTFDSADVPAGYYAFEAIASDGANSGTDLEILRVTTVVLQITDIVLITATEELAQISGHSNKDCSYQIYENNSLQGSGSVSSGWFSVSWTKDSTAGAYIELGIKFYVGVYSDWINGSYSVASSEVLQITDTLYSPTDDWNYLGGHASLGVTAWTAYNNNTQMNTGSLSAGSFSINWAKNTTVGLYEWGVSFTDGTTTRWVNGTFEIPLIELDVDIEAWSVEDNVIEITGISNLDMAWYIYNEGVYSTENGAETEDIGFTFDFAKISTVGKHNFSIYFNDTVDGSQSRWFNRSYTISTVYGEATIKAYFSSAIGIEDIEDKFKIYVDGTRSSDSFYADISGTYEICVKDFFDNEIYNASHAWAKFIDIEFAYYTLKVYSQVVEDPIYFTLTIGGATISEYLGPNEILRYYLAAGTYTYSFRQGGMVYSDELVLDDDDYYTVEDLDLWDIFRKPAGGGGDDDVMELYILNVLTFGILGLFGFVFLVQIPSIMNWLEGKKQSRSGSPGDRRRRY